MIYKELNVLPPTVQFFNPIPVKTARISPNLPSLQKTKTKYPRLRFYRETTPPMKNSITIKNTSKAAIEQSVADMANMYASTTYVRSS